MRIPRVILAVLLLLTASGAARAQKRVQLRLDVPAKSARGIGDVARRTVLEAFQKKHPEIDVVRYVKLSMPGPRGEAIIYMAMAGDTAPDALYVYGRSIQKYMDQNFLYPLNEYLTPEIIKQPEFQMFLRAISRVVTIDEYVELLRNHDVENAETFGKNIPESLRVGEDKIKLVYGVPALTAVAGLVYRKDLFDQAGLDPARAPKNWDELRDYARKLTIPRKGQVGLGLPGGRYAGWRFPNFVWQAGGEILRQDPEDGSWRLAFDEEAPLVALRYLRGLIHDKWTNEKGETVEGALTVNSDLGQLSLDFVEGRLAMLVESTAGEVGGRFLERGLDPSQIGLAPLPAGPTGIQATMLEGEFYGINQLVVHDKERRDAAWKFIKFIVSDEAKRITTRTYVEAGRAVLVNPLWLKKFGYEAELRLVPPEWVDLYDDILKFAKLEPFAPGYDQVQAEVMAKLDGVFHDAARDPKEVLLEMTREANSRHFGKTRAMMIARYRFYARIIFTIFLSGIALLVGVFILRWRRKRRELMQVHAEALIGADTPGKRELRRKMEVLAWLFMLPAVLSILIWKYYPLVSGARLAFMDYRILGDDTFVGLDNFIEAFTQPMFWRAFGQTAVYAGLSLGLGFLLPIFLAFLLSEIPRFRMFFRTVFYLPAITSGLVVMFIWKMMYEKSVRGIFNRGLMWVSNDPLGRTVMIGIFIAAWAMVLSLLIGIVARILHHYHPKSAVVPIVLLALMLPFWGDMLHEIGVLGPQGEYFLFAHLGKLTGFTTPLLFATQAALRAAVLLVTMTGVLMLYRMRGEFTGRQLFWTAGAALVLVSASLALHLNAILMPMKKPYPWLNDPTGYWAMLWVVLPGIWAYMGPGCIIYLAALKSIPEDLYEAADVDGAGPLEKAYHVTFQYLKPLIIINFVGAFVGTFHAMQNILVMTGGGPGDSTMTIGMDIFFNAFTHLKFGYATAEAWILGSLLIGFTLYQLRILKKLRFTRAEN